MSTLFVKRCVMGACSVVLGTMGLLQRRKMGEVKTIGILFCKPLGIGDLIMLSPVIQRFTKIFSQSSVTLITWIPPFIAWNNIEVITCEEAQKNKRRFDLIVSPTLSMRHMRFVLRAKYWIGYFSSTWIQSNLRASHDGYSGRNEHYLSRAVRVLKALNVFEGEAMEREVAQKKLVYPRFLATPPSYVEKLSGKRYAVVSIFSKWEDRQWSQENFARIVASLLERKCVDVVVLTGDDSAHNRDMAERFVELVGASAEKIINATGRSSLSDVAYLIEHAVVFLGVDSGPAHIAYIAAQRAVVVFVTCDPRTRLPLCFLGAGIKTVYPEPHPATPLYNGHTPVPLDTARMYAIRVSFDHVVSTIDEVMSV